jgi:5-methylcytosine-specific restriction endonuclease McrA
MFKDGKDSMKYCSRICKDESQRGFEPPRLAANRGKKPRTYHLRHRDKHGSAADRDWRKAVFERDDYTCQLCFVRGGKLQADHIKPFKAFPELRLVLENGRTLCVGCHRKTETYGWSAYWRRPEIAANRLRQEVLQFA